MLGDQLVRTPDIRDLEACDARLATALRLWVIMSKLGALPDAGRGRPARIGARRGASAPALLEEVGAAWPDPFCIAPPCCPRLSHDDTLALAMVRAAAREDRPAFDRLLQEMIPADMRERLYLSAGVLGRVLAA
jgi:hypothetical protein